MDTLSVENRTLLRRYFRLLLSHKDFKHALKCAEWLVSRGDAYVPEVDVATSAHYCSMVVSYARPFNSGGNSEKGKIPRLQFQYLPDATDAEAEIHNYVLFCRNKLVAHTDAEALDLEPIVATDLPEELVVPLVNDALAPFLVGYTTEFAKLAERWMIWVLEERVRIERLISPFLKRSTWREIYGIEM